MPSIKQLAKNETASTRFVSGHSLCRGCGIPIVVRAVLNSIETPVVVMNATGCLEVATTRYPHTTWQVPWLHVAFENAAAAASGVETAYKALVKRGRLPNEPTTFVVFGGDGGTYDIGLQALSGALERGHRFLYVCYDNEAYMNTGIQRSSATPFAASTTTSPAGKQSFGKLQERKDLTAIAVAHHIPYVAQASISHWQDLSDKVAVATSLTGPSFINVLSTCPLGWGSEASQTVRFARLATETRYWPLYEVIEGHYRITERPLEPSLPIQAWLKDQARFKHLFQHESAEVLTELQREVDHDWDDLERRSEADMEWFAEHGEQSEVVA